MSQQESMVSFESSDSENDEEIKELKRSSSWPSTSTKKKEADDEQKKCFIGTYTHIQRDILSNPLLISIASRYNITPTQQATFTEALIQESGGDVFKVATSYATADKARRTVTSNISSKIKETWLSETCLLILGLEAFTYSI